MSHSRIANGIVFRIIAASCIYFLWGCSLSSPELSEKNDYFTFFNKDHDYTQGLEVSAEAEKGTRYRVGQDIFTPAHKKIVELIPDERPYAGWLYGGKEVLNTDDEGVVTSRSIDIGVVGPGAGGKQIQRGVHDLLGQFKPVGWNNQLDNEPGIILGVRREHPSVRKYISLLSGDTSVDYRARLGNVYTDASLGTKTTWGVGTKAQLFAGPNVRAVARNIFLDGNTFSDSHSVGKEYFVGEMAGGVLLKLGGWSVRWTLIISTPEFKSQKGAYNYGIVTIRKD